jgi:hypothetical protein
MLPTVSPGMHEPAYGPIVQREDAARNTMPQVRSTPGYVSKSILVFAVLGGCSIRGGL